MIKKTYTITDACHLQAKRIGLYVLSSDKLISPETYNGKKCSLYLINELNEIKQSSSQSDSQCQAESK